MQVLPVAQASGNAVNHLEQASKHAQHYSAVQPFLPTLKTNSFGSDLHVLRGMCFCVWTSIQVFKSCSMSDAHDTDFS